jgi:hypothetical protein
VLARFLALVVVVAACSPRAATADDPPPRRAFYYWRTTFALSEVERRAIAELGVTRLYVRAFDVTWQVAAGAQLAGALETRERAPAGVEIVPVVFVRDEVLRHADPRQLARDIWTEAKRRAELVGATPRELQLDCDWTEATRAAFFALVERVRAESGVAISATIRLHQIKYRERTGVPPVDRGTLMFYNMGRFSADPDARMIFDAASAEKYLARIGDYPLPLDVALPIWSWTVHLRDDRAIGLLQSTDPDELAAVPFLARAGADRYVARQTAFLHGELLREGDVLKIEVTGPAETAAAADMLAPRLAAVAPSMPRTVTLFDLSERNITRHGTSELEHVFRAVR